MTFWPFKRRKDPVITSAEMAKNRLHLMVQPEGFFPPNFDMDALVHALVHTIEEHLKIQSEQVETSITPPSTDKPAQLELSVPLSPSE